MPRNHASKRARRRLHKRIRIMTSKRCTLCRRKLDPLFYLGRDGKPCCSRHRPPAAPRNPERGPLR